MPISAQYDTATQEVTTRRDADAGSVFTNTDSKTAIASIGVNGRAFGIRLTSLEGKPDFACTISKNLDRAVNVLGSFTYAINLDAKGTGIFVDRADVEPGQVFRAIGTNNVKIYGHVDTLSTNETVSIVLNGSGNHAVKAMPSTRRDGTPKQVEVIGTWTIQVDGDTAAAMAAA